MAEKEMYDYLSDTTADYTTTELSIKPQNVLPHNGSKQQIYHRFDSGKRVVVSLSDNSFFEPVVDWGIQTPEDAGTILDMYHDTAKANGGENTFYWVHPKDGHTYVARFLEPPVKEYDAKFPNHIRINPTRLSIEGRKAEV